MKKDSRASGDEIRPPGVQATAAHRVVAIDPQEDPRWKLFVRARPEGLIYHHPLWLKVIEKAYGYKPLGLACEGTDGRLRGVLPLFRAWGLLTGNSVSSLPHTPVAGPIASDDQSITALLRAAVEQVREKSQTRMVLKSMEPNLESRVEGLTGLPQAETFVLDLPERPEDLRFGNSRNHARIRWAVNKAIRSGLRVRPAETPGDLRDWYRLYLDTMREHAVPPRPFRFFQTAWDLLVPAGLMRLLLAEQHTVGRRRLLAGSILLMFNRTVFYAFNGRSRDDLGLRPNDLIQWQAIQDACEDGFRRYDFGEVKDSQTGLAQFKGKWGAEPKRLYRYYYPTPSRFEINTRNSNSRGGRIWGMAWRRLPLGVTAVAGNWAFRYLVG